MGRFQVLTFPDFSKFFPTFLNFSKFVFKGEKGEKRGKKGGKKGKKGKKGEKKKKGKKGKKLLRGATRFRVRISLKRVKGRPYAPRDDIGHGSDPDE